MSSGHGRGAVSRVAWPVLAIVLAAALAFSVSQEHGPRTVAERAAAIDSNLKCPSCDAISVEDSSASTAAAVRQVVLARVREGQSDQQIEQYLESRYGPSILLRPPTTGITAVVWVVPLVAAAAGLGGVGLLFWRRRRPASVAVTEQDRALVDRELARRRGADGGTAPAVPGR